MKYKEKTYTKKTPAVLLKNLEAVYKTSGLMIPQVSSQNIGNIVKLVFNLVLDYNYNKAYHT